VPCAGPRPPGSVRHWPGRHRSTLRACPTSFTRITFLASPAPAHAVGVARGLVPFSLGTTRPFGRGTGGVSNNLVGLKPTRGRFQAPRVSCRPVRSPDGLVFIFPGNFRFCPWGGKNKNTSGIFFFWDRGGGPPGINPGVAGVGCKPLTPADGLNSRVAVLARLIRCPKTLPGHPASLPWFGDSQAEAAWHSTLRRCANGMPELIELEFHAHAAKCRTASTVAPGVAERYAAIAEFMDAMASR